MTKILEMMAINGIVLLDGHRVPNARVLLLSSEMNQLLASASTSIDGKYEIKFSPADSVVLVVKIQGPVLALDHRLIKPGEFLSQQDFNINTSLDAFCTVEGEIITDEHEAPSYVEVDITPVHLNAVPSAIEKFFLRFDKGVVDASYYEERVSSNHFKIKVQKGSYRISGQNIIYKGPDSTLPALPNFIVGNIFADEEKDPLPGEQFGGFILDVRRDRKILMNLKILADNF
jgi:hypothetical protein